MLTQKSTAVLLRQAAESRGQCMSGKALSCTFPGCMHSPVPPQTPSQAYSAPGVSEYACEEEKATLSAVQGDGDAN